MVCSYTCLVVTHYWPWAGDNSVLQFIVSLCICIMTKFSYCNTMVSTAHMMK